MRKSGRRRRSAKRKKRIRRTTRRKRRRIIKRRTRRTTSKSSGNRRRGRRISCQFLQQGMCPIQFGPHRSSNSDVVGVAIGGMHIGGVNRLRGRPVNQGQQLSANERQVLEQLGDVVSEKNPLGKSSSHKPSHSTSTPELQDDLARHISREMSPQKCTQNRTLPHLAPRRIKTV